MKLSVLLIALETALAPLAETVAATVETFITPEDALRKLENAPEKVRILIGYGGSDLGGTMGNHDRTKINVIIQAARGLSFDPAADALRGTTTNAALLDVIEQVQTWVRSIRFYTDDAQTLRSSELDPAAGFKPVSTAWLGDSDQSLPSTRTAVLTFVILRAIPGAAEIKATLPAA